LSLALYEKLVDLWREYIYNNLHIFSSLMSEEEVEEEYEDLVNGFCEKHNYSERTKNYFFDRWYDTFADMYFQELEKAIVKIIHDNPQKGDWDFGKKFEFTNKGYWQESNQNTISERDEKLNEV